MPRFWRLTILGSQEWPYGTPCIATPCLALVGKQFLLEIEDDAYGCLLYTSPSPRDRG